MAVEQVAQAHYQAQQTIARGVAEQGQVLWGEIDPAAVLETWMALLDAMTRALTLGQMAAAALAQPYLNAMAQQQDIPTAPAGIVNPAAFAGLAADGRDLASLLVQPALRTLGLLARGADDQDALRSGLASLTRILSTETADAARAADHAGLVANRSWVTYVRQVTLPACGRCVVLAGREYSWSTGFQRHEQCDCSMVPRRDGQAPLTSPKELFERMSREEQNRAFTKADAQAIRDGADLGQVVNARRGMTVVGDRSVTTEGTSRRGLAGRRAGATSGRRSAVRPTPAQIYADAAGDRDEAIRLLRRFAYIV
ncbi:hypothetical protein AB0J63_26615 [Streptosporangium canum]|uniref:VG15 protein n=1 Tax=Streptosporangium canum TaxID=324952 RepID=UPI0034420648